MAGLLISGDHSHHQTSLSPRLSSSGTDCLYIYENNHVELDFKKLFSLKKEKGQKLFSLPSFTAPDTEVLQSFSGLDPRLKERLEISDLNEYVEWLRETCWSMMVELSEYTRKHSASRAPRSSQY